MILLTVIMVVAGGSDSHISMMLMQLSGGEVNDGYWCSVVDGDCGIVINGVVRMMS